MRRLVIFYPIIILSLLSCFDNGDTNSVLKNQKSETKSLNLDNKTFSQLWAIVDSLRLFREEESLYLVGQFILQKGFQENEEEHAIRAVTTILSAQHAISTDNELLIIENIETIADSSKGVIQSILYSMAADLNSRYYFKNEHKFRNKKIDIISDRTEWSRKIFLEHISNLFRKSLSNIDALKLSEVSIYKNLIRYDEQTEQFRPSLYNVFVHRAINFYSDILMIEKNNTGLKKNIILPLKSFMEILKNDTGLSDQLAKLYQDILRFNLANQHIYAYVQTNLERLEFYNKLIYSANDDHLYFNALINFSKQYQNHPASALIIKQIAKYYQSIGSYNEAVDVLEKNLAKFPNSVLSEDLKLLLKQLKKPILNIDFNNNVLPNTLSNIQMNHRFVTSVYIVITPVTLNSFLRKEIDDLTGNEQLNPITKAFDLKLNSKNQLEKSDYPLDPLKAGVYSISIVFKDSEGQIHEIDDKFLSVSNQDFVKRRLSKYSVEFYFFDRISGKPLSNRQIEIKKQNPKNDQYETIDSFLTDRQGFVEVLIQNEDELFIVSQFESDLFVKPFKIGDLAISRYTNQMLLSQHSYLVSDTIKFYLYFQPEKKTAFQQHTVYLEDIDGNQLDSISLIADRYGLATGKFTIDGQLILEQYQLNVEGINYPVRINRMADSSKRSINLALSKNDYRAGDNIKITGNLKNFNPFLDLNKKVTISLIRLYNKTEILFKTELPLNERGEFNYSFKSENSKNSYRIMANYGRIVSEDLTNYFDFNLSKDAFDVQLQISNSIKSGDPVSILIQSNNILKISESIKGSLNIYRLPNSLNQAPDRLNIPKQAILVYSKKISTNEEITVSSKKWRKGRYLVSFNKARLNLITKYFNVLENNTDKLHKLSHSIIYNNESASEDIVELWIGSSLKDVDGWIEFRNRFAQKRSYIRLSEEVRKIEFKRSLLDGFDNAILFFAKNGEFYQSECQISKPGEIITVDKKNYKPNALLQLNVEKKDFENQFIYNFVKSNKLNTDQYLQWDSKTDYFVEKELKQSTTLIKSLSRDQLNWFNYQMPTQNLLFRNNKFGIIMDYPSQHLNEVSVNYLMRKSLSSNVEIKLPAESGTWTMQTMQITSTNYKAFHEYQFETKKDLNIEVPATINSFSGSELIIPLHLSNYSDFGIKGTAIFKVMNMNKKIIHHDVKPVRIYSKQNLKIEWPFKVPDLFNQLIYNIEVLTEKDREVKFGKIRIRNSDPLRIINKLMVINKTTNLNFKSINTDSIQIDISSSLKDLTTQLLIENRQSLFKTDDLLNQLVNENINNNKFQKNTGTNLDELFFDLFKMQNTDGGFARFTGLESNINTSLYFLRVIYELKRLRVPIVNQPNLNYSINQTVTFLINNLTKQNTEEIDNERINEILLFISVFQNINLSPHLNEFIKRRQNQLFDENQISLKSKLIRVILLNKQFKRTESAKLFFGILNQLPIRIENLRNLSLLFEAATDLSKSDESLISYGTDQFANLYDLNDSEEYISLFSISSNLPQSNKSIDADINIDGKISSINSSRFTITIGNDQQIKLNNFKNPFLAKLNYKTEETSSSPIIEHRFFRQRLTSTSGIQLEKIADKGLRLADIVIVEITLNPDSLYKQVTIEDYYPAGFEVLSTAPEFIGNENGNYYQYQEDGRMIFYIDQFVSNKLKIQYPLRAVSKGKLKKGYTRIIVNGKEIFYNFDTDFISIN